MPSPPDSALLEATEPPGCDRRRVRVRVQGRVQGVGFRPFVHRLASELKLSGWVRNDAQGVLLEAEGSEAAVVRLLDRLGPDSPPLARVDATRTEARPLEASTTFQIVSSQRGGPRSAHVPPDAATCADCLRELLDPNDRRYRYPFINCTNCGPRFSLIQGIPYDRPNTTMASFVMCRACRAEYDDPGDRRFHAQPNACPECGPSARLLDATGRSIPAAGGRDPVEEAARALVGGAIVAVKGLGGYHLACRADHGEAVGTLRARKHREDKPFAVMVADLESAHTLVVLAPEEEALLTRWERPIVLAPRRAGVPLAPAVAPGYRELGVFLPYTPLHHLLLAGAGGPLVFTSGNVSDEPLAYRDAEALDRLAEIADLFLAHDRPIETRTDDSVVRAVSHGRDREPMILRRARGWVPAPRRLPLTTPVPLLACGGHLKNTFALARGEDVWIGPHVGDLENFETLASFRDGIAHLERLFQMAPAVLVHDLHPDYLSTSYARERAEADGVECLGVQHHHAHMAGCLAEHGVTARVVAAVYDGTGYGTDGTVWGGEILVGNLARSERAAHLWPVRLPGGRAAVREPWRMACAWLVALGDPEPELPEAFSGQVSPESWSAVARMAVTGLHAPETTSMGRLFDAVAALCGLRIDTTYEGQAAIELEMAVDPTTRGSYPMPVVSSAHGPAVLDARATISAVVDDLARGATAGIVAARVHRGVARGTVEACAIEASRHGIDAVALTGGVFQNVQLLEAVAEGLVSQGLRPLVPGAVPPNDGGLSWGQAACAAARLQGDS